MTIFTSIINISTVASLLNPSTPTGHGNDLHGKLIHWPSELVRYTSVCRRQSAGEAQGGAVRHQTDTWHIAAGLWR